MCIRSFTGVHRYGVFELIHPPSFIRDVCVLKWARVIGEYFSPGVYLNIWAGCLQRYNIVLHSRKKPLTASSSEFYNRSTERTAKLAKVVSFHIFVMLIFKFWFCLSPVIWFKSWAIQSRIMPNIRYIGYNRTTQYVPVHERADISINTVVECICVVATTSHTRLGLLLLLYGIHCHFPKFNFEKRFELGFEWHIFCRFWLSI